MTGTSAQRAAGTARTWSAAGPRAALVLVALACLIGAGCGSAGQSATTASTSAGGTSASGQDRGVRFAECIREHGVPDFPDPNAKGEFVFGVDVSPAVWQKAVEACKALQPPGSLSAERSPTQQTAALRFARCIRRNGVTDFPDPANGAPLIDTTHIPSTDRSGGMSRLNAAIQTCHALLAEAATGR